MVMPGSRPHRFLDGLFALPLLRFALWIAIFAALFPGVFAHPEKLIAFMDDHQFTNWEEADRIAIARYGELPLWNPYYCGGMVSAAAPENGVFAPDYLLRLAFGVIQGRRLALALFMVMGMEGLYRLTRQVEGTALSGVFAATVGSTFNALVSTYGGMGWVNFFGFELIPWVVLGVLKGRESVAWRFVGAMFLGWIALAAGTYTAPYTGIAVAFLTIAMCLGCLMPLQPKELKATLLSAATVGVGGGLLAVAKLVPMMLVMRHYPRVFTPVEAHDPMKLFTGYWPVYGVVVLLAVASLFFKDKWARLFFATAVLFFVLAMGQFAEWAPGSIMRKLPLVKGLRLPERYMVVFHTFLVLAAARGVSHFEDLGASSITGLWGRLRKKARPLEKLVVPIAAGVLMAAVVFRYGREQVTPMLEAVKIPVGALYGFDPPRRVEQEFKQARGNRRDAHIWPYANRGTLYCFVGIPLPDSADLRADLPQEEYPADPSVAKVQRLAWSPHSIKLHVEASAPTRILVNQNFNEHWTSDVGTPVNANWLLGMDVPQGSYDLTIKYRDGSSVFCMLVSLGTLLAMLGWIGKTNYPLVRARAFEYRDLLVGPPEPKKVEPKKEEEEKPAESSNDEDEEEEQS